MECEQTRPRLERYFLLSPAFLGGKRGALLRTPASDFPLARRIRSEGAPLGEVYRFVSGLYFRGKLTYASTFAVSSSHVQVITPSRGLVSPDVPIRLSDLEEFAAIDIGTGDSRFHSALERSSEALIRRSPLAEVVLLGSVATGKYTDVLLDRFGERLLFPAEFVGRGDMSRGGLMLRTAAAGVELDYISVRGAERRGRRPPRLSSG